MTDLHLIRLPLELRDFTSWALHRRYLQTPPGDGSGRPRSAEIGYALHAALAGLFGGHAPRPFVWPPVGQRERQGAFFHAATNRAGLMDLLGYAHAPMETLETLAQLDNSGLSAMIDWERAGSKPMPTHWPKDLRLRFDLRACPVRRLMYPLVTPYKSKHRATTLSKGKEVDAYQLAAIRALERGERSPTRDETYIEWLAQWLSAKADRPQVVSLIPGSVRVESYRSVRLLRRPRNVNGNRYAQWLTRPDVHFTGLLEITEPLAFLDLLARGIGRHCGFGFGMLLLRPA